MDRKRLTAVAARYDSWCMVCCKDGWEETSMVRKRLTTVAFTYDGWGVLWCETASILIKLVKKIAMNAKTRKLWKTVKRNPWIGI